MSDSAQRSGTVTYIFRTRKVTELIVDWDDGTTGIHYQPEDFVLIERVQEDMSQSQ